METIHNHMIEFNIDAVTGTIMAIINCFGITSMDNLRVSLIVSGKDVLIKYYNDAWQSVHIHDDEFITNSFQTMMAAGVFSHPSCLFGYIFNHAQALLHYSTQTLLETSVGTSGDFATAIRPIIKHIVTSTCKSMGEFTGNMSCNANCKPYNYVPGENYII